MRFKILFGYRELIRNFVARDLKARYKGSILGFFWSFLNPLLNLLILALVFSFLVKAGIKNFVVFLLIGILLWQFLSSSLIIASRTIIDNGGLIKKIFLPREVFPLSVVIANLVNFFFALVILILLLFYFQIFPSMSWLLFPYFLFLFSIFIFGLTLIVSSLSVFFRDIPILIESLIPAWYFASPIFYPPTLVPVRFQQLYFLNPAAAFVTGFRTIIMDHALPSKEIFLVTAMAALVALLIGYSLFIKLERYFAEEI